MPVAAVAIAAGIAMFILPGRGRREMVLTWKDAEDGLPWGVLLLFGGGLSLASAVAATGLDAWFGVQASGLGALPLILLIAPMAPRPPNHPAVRDPKAAARCERGVESGAGPLGSRRPLRPHGASPSWGRTSPIHSYRTG